ncbi:MAG: alpha/beta hydrolase [Phototrophicaceae bacterium]
MFKRLVFSIIVLTLLSIPLAAQDTPAFESAPCPVAIPFGFVEDTGAGSIECGFVTVPEFHAVPDGNQIRVAVAIIHSTTPNPAADPVFMEQGGPGGSTIDLFVQLAPLFAPILAERDIVLVEQRGTLYSEPSLTCPEILEDSLAIIDQEPVIDSFFADGGAYQRCFERLQADGVNLSAFNSVENAADMISVADALNYDEINFYGVSYGTMLGQHLLRDFEDRIRSIVFDAVVPLELNFLPDVVATANEAISVVFAECAADEVCNALYPDLETTTFETVAALNANPVLVPIYDVATGEAYDAFFNGDIFLQLLRGLQYTSEFVPSLPAFINATANEDYEWIERLYGLIAIESARSIADGMYVSVICAEDADFTDEDITNEGVRDEYINNQSLDAASITQACEIAQVDLLDDYVDAPVISDVPALLTSGQYDPVTPPRYGDILAANLSNGTHIVFPAVGHGALLGGACPVSVIAEFFSDPEAELNTDCIDDMGVTFNEFTTDPTGRLQFALPTTLEDVSNDVYASYVDEALDITLSVIAVDELDIDAAINEALSTIIRDGFATPPLADITQETGFGEVVTRVYQDGTTFVITYAQVVEDVSSVVIIQFPPAQIAMIDPLLLPIATNMFSVD